MSDAVTILRWFFLGDPVELVLEGQRIAQGEEVLINGKGLGVRIISLDN